MQILDTGKSEIRGEVRNIVEVLVVQYNYIDGFSNTSQ
jgi:hypothetical protein